MAVTYFEVEDLLETDEISGKLNLDVHIGDGHVGAFVVTSDKKIVSVNETCVFEKIEDLKNKWITTVVTIKDTLDETNWTSVRLEFFNERKRLKYGPFKREVGKNLDTVIYIIRIKVV